MSTPNYIAYPDGLKTCKRCGRSKPATTEYYHFGKLYHGQLRPVCIQCCKEEYLNLSKETKKSLKKKQYQRHVEIYGKGSDNARLRVYSKNNPEKRRVTRQQSQKRRLLIDPDRKREQSRIDCNRRRTRKLKMESSFTKRDWQYAVNYFNGCCAVCGRPAGLWHTLAADHWIPISDPHCPGTIPMNIIPLCHGVDGCNNSKWNRHPVEWLQDKFGIRKSNVILRRIETYFDSLKERK